MRTARQGTVRIRIDAPADRVWAVIADLERMGEWSPECYRVVRETGGSSPPGRGTRFRGWNRYGWMRWSMPCQVETAEPGRELSWSTVRRGKPMTTWTYRIEPLDRGVELVESFEVHWLPLMARVAEDYLMPDRDRRREQGMGQTLERIKALAEREPAS